MGMAVAFDKMCAGPVRPSSRAPAGPGCGTEKLVACEAECEGEGEVEGGTLDGVRSAVSKPSTIAPRGRGQASEYVEFAVSRGGGWLRGRIATHPKCSSSNFWRACRAWIFFFGTAVARAWRASCAAITLRCCRVRQRAEKGSRFLIQGLDYRITTTQSDWNV